MMEGDPGSGPSTSQASSSSKPTPKHEASAASGASGAGGTPNPQLSKRRRGLGVVTPNACTECRKKRAKCDGQKPCGRCKSQKEVECIYEIPVRQSKENLRHEIEVLRRQQRQSDSVFSALVRPDLIEEVLQRLRQGQTVEGISEWLGSSSGSGPTLPAPGSALPGFPRPSEARVGVTLPPLSTYGGTLAGAGGYNAMGMSPTTAQAHGMNQDFDPNSPWNFSSHSQTVSTRSDSHPDIMQWTAEAPPRSRVGLWLQDQSSVREGPRYRGVDQVLAPFDSPEMKVPPGTWTTVTGDGGLVSHLLALYFCWEYPTFASLSKEHFMKDFLNGRNRYCSPILVNALLALGCRFSTQPNTRANPNDSRTAGDHFFKESLRLFYRENNHHNLTTIQALGIMSIREASCGRDSESWYYAGQSIRLAIEMGLHRLQNDGDEDEIAVQAATFWGAFALDHAWSLATGSLPQCSCFPHLPPKPAIIDDIEASLWVPYTDDGAPLQRSCEQPSNVRSVYKCFCELSELVHQSLYVLHSPGKPVTSRDLLAIYTQYLNWYDRIPEVLRLGHNFTPAVLFAHMYYHFAILLLFRPLIKLRIIGSGILPRDVCSQAADAIQGLLRSYSQLYTLRRTPSFVPYFVLTSSIMHLAIGAEASKGQYTSPTDISNPSTAKPEDADTDHSHGQLSSSTRDEPEPTSPSSTITAKLSPRVAEALNQGIAHLTEMAPCHHFAHQALNILQYLAKKWNIEVDIPPGSGVSEEIDNSVRPTTSSLNFFAPNVNEEDFLCAWGTRDIGGAGGAQRRYSSSTPQTHTNRGENMEGVIEGGRAKEMADQDPSPIFKPRTSTGPIAHTAQSLENPLFWPFPMQGRPMLPEGKQLEEAGFRPL
ncbi:fungal-specific transcription factor domain-containing protein [Annulohypoxylon maeteangense]|uniref:fungal-specific transcription factor domain-containing protein n=1 Tax=Annulohypoxylon maeteangense TaxID=1927788 RepID=UPI00200861FC|nr:fungal-specific transcription factor domain-containing protein [Annulohypoxylon maeteangense]KAI0886400.1 fungal-specific transcription factor domain-containing protein [Annulohypoxylon maeteangense]